MSYGEAHRKIMAEVLADIAEERVRQVEQEGWDAEHDDEHEDGSLARAAAWYALGTAIGRIDRQRGMWGEVMDRVWPDSWSEVWKKPRDPRRDLVKAGALIVAELERLARQRERDEADTERRWGA